MTHRDRCAAECTRDVIFLFQWTTARQKRGIRPHWHTEGVWLDRDEAETFGRAHAYRWEAWRVYGIPAEGALATILREQEQHVLPAPAPAPGTRDGATAPAQEHNNG